MTQENSSYERDLNQIREQAAKLLDEIDQIKDRHAGHELAEIEQIQNRTIATVAEIDAVLEKQSRAPEL